MNYSLNSNHEVATFTPEIRNACIYQEGQLQEHTQMPPRQDSILKRRRKEWEGKSFFVVVVFFICSSKKITSTKKITLKP